MLSKVIKERLEQKLGHTVRYPKDCDMLAADIAKVCKCQLSGSTMKRLFGFVKGGGQPRLYTLDLLSNYLGHGKWEDLLASLTGQRPIQSSEIEHLDINKAKTGSTIIITYAPAREVTLEVVEKGRLRLIESNEPLLEGVETVKCTEVKLHYPLYLEIPGKAFGVWLAQISGVTSIKTAKLDT